MILYLDNENRIIAVNTTDRTDLTEINLDETVIDFPFTGWSEARICCYRIEVENGHITMMTPYVPTHMFSAIENLESRNAEQGEQIISAEQSITDLDLQSIETEQTLTDMDLRLLALEV